MDVQYGGNIMSFMDDFYKRFVKEEYDENGIVTKFDLDLKYDYNFAYDVIDEIAKHEPARTVRKRYLHIKSFRRRAAVWQICSWRTALKRAIW